MYWNFYKIFITTTLVCYGCFLNSAESDKKILPDAEEKLQALHTELDKISTMISSLKETSTLSKSFEQQKNSEYKEKIIAQAKLNFKKQDYLKSIYYYKIYFSLPLEEKETEKALEQALTEFYIAIEKAYLPAEKVSRILASMQVLQLPKNLKFYNFYLSSKISIAKNLVSLSSWSSDFVSFNSQDNLKDKFLYFAGYLAYKKNNVSLAKKYLIECKNQSELQWKDKCLFLLSKISTNDFEYTKADMYLSLIKSPNQLSILKDLYRVFLKNKDFSQNNAQDAKNLVADIKKNFPQTSFFIPYIFLLYNEPESSLREIKDQENAIVSLQKKLQDFYKNQKEADDFIKFTQEASPLIDIPNHFKKIYNAFTRLDTVERNLLTEEDNLIQLMNYFFIEKNSLTENHPENSLLLTYTQDFLEKFNRLLALERALHFTNLDPEKAAEVSFLEDRLKKASIAQLNTNDIKNFIDEQDTQHLRKRALVLNEKLQNNCNKILSENLLDKEKAQGFAKTNRKLLEKANNIHLAIIKKQFDLSQPLIQTKKIEAHLLERKNLLVNTKKIWHESYKKSLSRDENLLNIKLNILWDRLEDVHSDMLYATSLKREDLEGTQNRTIAFYKNIQNELTQLTEKIQILKNKYTAITKMLIPYGISYYKQTLQEKHFLLLKWQTDAHFLLDKTASNNFHNAERNLHIERKMIEQKLEELERKEL